MKLRRNSLLAIPALIAALITVSFAQGPLNKLINYDINASHALRMGEYVLPPGKYILYQINSNDPNLFALYRNDRMRPPIAMIRTARIDFAARGYPEETKIFLNIDEERNGYNSLPELQGWTIPGMDGWEIISVVESKKGMLARADSYRTVAKASTTRGRSKSLRVRQANISRIR
jgi:hypothetical protein